MQILVVVSVVVGTAAIKTINYVLYLYKKMLKSK